MKRKKFTVQMYAIQNHSADGLKWQNKRCWDGWSLAGWK